MAEVPANQKLWAMLIMQAKAKYHPYPSPGASHWVHSQYIHMGGMFVDSQKKVDPRLRDKQMDQDNADKRKKQRDTEKKRNQK